MKTIQKILTVLLLCACTGFAMAGTSPDFKIMNAGGKAIAVIVHNDSSLPQVVKLQDEDGNILLADRVKSQNNYSRKLNLVNLPRGTYQVLLEDKTRTIVQPVNVDVEMATVDATKRTSIFAPAVQVSPEKIDLTLLCLEDAMVTIQIMDEQGNVSYSETTNEHGSVQRRFNISGLSPGDYTVVTKVKGPAIERSYSESFELGETVAAN